MIMANPDFNYIELFESYPSERALFLTYALSLTFFETVLLRHLRRAECQEIWVIADADGYQMSLSERKSTRVGQEYHLVPVALKSGVFHPKCVYLSSQKGDLLIVGSGNLTFGGYGRNFEVAEILTPDKAPLVFSDFADFLDQLKEREDFMCPDPKWMTDFGHYARSSAKSNTGDAVDQPRLITSVEKAVAPQLVRKCESIGSIHSIVCLSPFYSEDAEAIKYVSEKTRTKSLDISLPPDKSPTSAFPFAKAASWKTKIRAVYPKVKNAKLLKRPLHAKWIELHGNTSSLTVVGSINATNQAMLTKNNIEVGVLREWKKLTTEITWESTAIPKKTEIREFGKSGIGTKIIVYANIRDDGRIEGSILSKDDPSGEWKAVVVKPDGTSISFKVHVDNEGKFKTKIVDLEQYSYASSLQIMLNKDTLRARGWIHQEDILKIPRTSRLSITSILRMINREETEDDELALLDYLAISAHKHMSIFNRAVKAMVAEKKAKEGEEPVFSISVDLLKPESDPSQIQQPHDHHSQTAEHALERFIMQLRRRLLGNNAPKHTKKAIIRSTDEVDTEDDDEVTIDNTLAHVRDGLEEFNEEMEDIVQRAEDHAVRTTALVMSIEVSMHMYQRRLDDLEEARYYLRQWLPLACNNVKINEEISAIEQHAYAAAALMSCVTTAKSFQAEKDEDSLSKRFIHELLERFYNGSVDTNRAVKVLSDFIEASYINWMLNIPTEGIIDSFKDMLSTKTIRAELLDVIHAVRKKLGLSNFPNFRSNSWIKLFQLMKHRKAFVYLEGLENQYACPHCHMELPTGGCQDLDQYRLAYCDNCGIPRINWFSAIMC